MSDLTFSQSELSQRLSRLIKRGTVHSVQASPPRCRVTLGSDAVTGETHVSDWLLWFAHADSERSDWSMPAVGAPAIVFSEGGDLLNGLVFPLGITGDQAPAGGSPTEHVTRYSDGAVVAYDSGAHALTVSLPAGATAKLAADGGITLDGPVTITGTLTVEQRAEVKGDIAGGGNISAAGDITDQGGSSGSVQRIREVFNEHQHPENGDGGGTTSPPNQQL